MNGIRKTIKVLVEQKEAEHELIKAMCSHTKEIEKSFDVMRAFQSHLVKLEASIQTEIEMLQNVMLHFADK